MPSCDVFMHVQHFIDRRRLRKGLFKCLLNLEAVQCYYSSLYRSRSASNASTVTVSVPISELLSMSYTVGKTQN